MVTLLGAATADAQTCIPSVSCPASGYCNRFTCIANGAVTFTGDTLGLSKAVGMNQPGTSDAIGGKPRRPRSIRTRSTTTRACR